jgi:hypothetical protein
MSHAYILLEDVASSLEPPLRTCRTCGNVERNLHYRCTKCGRDYAAPPPAWRRAGLWLAVAMAALLIAGLAVAIPLQLSAKRESQARQASAHRAAAVREAARLTLAQRPRAGRLGIGTPGRSRVAPDRPEAPAVKRLRLRRAELVAFEAAVTRDARARFAAAGTQGRARETLCGPLERVTRGTRLVNTGEELDLGVRVGRYDCVAVLRDVVKDGRVVAHFGHEYVGALDFATASYVLCLAFPHPTENDARLAVAPLPRACVNAHGARLQSGFAKDARDTRHPLPALAQAARSRAPHAPPQ